VFQQFLQESRHLYLPAAALVLFFVVFLGVVAGIVRGMVRRRRCDHVASLPLEDDATSDSRGGSTR
jgi:cbb3-type cytochrome oxidase subunit 3